MKTLLLIEDDTVLRETTAEILELEDYKVVVAANGKRGIEQARIMLPDLIICDIMMPELDGYDVFKLLSEDETTKKIPFIFMSAKTEIKDIRKGMDLGADDYLTKPVEEELLLSAIESRLAKSALLNESLIAEENENSESSDDVFEDIFRATCGNPQQLHSLSFQIACEAEHNNGYVGPKEFDAGYKIWVQESLTQHIALIEARLNKKNTKILHNST